MNISKISFPAIYAFVLLLNTTLPSFSQENKNFRELFRKAEYFVITEEYEKAINLYEQLLEIDPENANILFLTGYSMINADYPISEAESLLELAVQNVDNKYTEGSHIERKAPPLAYFLLGKAYLINYKFDRAIEFFKEYKSNIDYWDFAENEYVTRYINACETAKNMVNNPLEVELELQNFHHNPDASLSTPVISGDQSIMLFHLRSQENEGIAMITKTDSAHWSEPVMIDDALKISDDHYPTCLSYDGKTLFLAVYDDVSADIYVSYFDGSTWSEASKMRSPISTKYLETHASISKDGNTLYFTSNRKNGWGGMDIYRCTKNKNGKWKNAENLGFGINSFYNEETPFLANNDTTLYFSSEGHNTMGGYDVYYAHIDKDGAFTSIKNIGFPISTPDDDIFFNPAWNSKKNYLVRHLKDNPKRAKIYSMILKPQPVPEELVAWNNPDSAAVMEDIAGNLIHKENPNNQTKKPISQKTNTVEPDKDNHQNTDDRVNDTGTKTQKNTANNNSKQKLKENSTQSVSPFYYIQNSVFFDFNSWEIEESFFTELDRLASVMNLYKSINIELIGNADAIGSFEYNYELAKKRARAVKQYIANKGISENRIITDVHGEAYPLAMGYSQNGKEARIGRAINRNVLIRIDNSGTPNVQLAEMFVPSKLVPEQDKIYCIYLADSKGYVDSIPKSINGMQVTLVYTRKSKVYTLGSFNTKLDAIAQLDPIIDMGYREAGIMERRRFENVIREQSGKSEYATANYTIQIFALKNPLKSLPSVNEQKVKVFKGKDGLYRYICGEYKTVQEAQSAISAIKNAGHTNAFIRPLIYYQVTSEE